MEDHSERVEEPWTNEREKYIRSLADAARQQSDLHNDAGYYFNGKRTRWVLPSLFLPVIMAGMSTMIEAYEFAYMINSILFIIIGSLNVYNEFKRFTEKRSTHFNYAGRWDQIVGGVEAELHHDNKYRLPYDVYSMRVNMLIGNIKMNEPMLPKFLITKAKTKRPPRAETRVLI
jgi:hypothetical protein